MTETDHDPTIGSDGLTCYQRWERSDAPFKAECGCGLCISYYHPIDCKGCRKDMEALKV